MTKAMSKPLIPIYDKPMVYYPLSVLLTAGIRDIMLITAPPDVESYQRLLGDGSQYGVHMSYGIQYVARGIADAFLIAEDFLAGDRCCLVLGDNMFHGEQLSYLLWDAAQQESGATIFWLSGSESAVPTAWWNLTRTTASFPLRKSRSIRNPITPCRVCISMTARRSSWPKRSSPGARRAGDHGAERGISQARRAARRADDARHGVA